MAKVQCEYCGAFINDTMEYCDQCGALNSNHQRLANDTPRTIAQLQSWYVARKLPPENVTRFFIGKDIREPKAFGIYQKGNNFVVYKNKANGQRAVRYEGTDEAYAVNEIYMKLKEEILRQKNLNYNARQNGYRATNNQYGRNVNPKSSYKPANNFKPSGPENYDRFKPKHNSSSSRTRNKLSFGIFGGLIVIILLIAFAFSAITGSMSSIFDFVTDDTAGYYISNTNDIYYCEGRSAEDNYIWWAYNKANETWSQHDVLKEDEYPTNVDEDDNYSSSHDVAKKLNLDEEDVNIFNHRVFIDAGHHKTPSTSYYYCDDKLYYYLDDTHSNYGTNNSGWYIYQNDNWEYYCSEDDKDALGEELWYSDSKYSLGTDYSNMYDFVGDLAGTWHPTDFEDTSWYQSYESNNNAYQNDIEDRYDDDDDDYNWDNDDDYDWDNDYDWDYGGGDWDSDW